MITLRNVKGVVERKRILGTNETAVHVEARVQKDVDRIQFLVRTTKVLEAASEGRRRRPYLHATFTTNTFHHVFIFITQNSYMFQAYIVGIFRQLQVWSTCTAYLATCHR
jgi:hypothetical protein